MYQQAIDNEFLLQQLNEENEALKLKLEKLEKLEQEEQKKIESMKQQQQLSSKKDIEQFEIFKKIQNNINQSFKNKQSGNDNNRYDNNNEVEKKKEDLDSSDKYLYESLIFKIPSILLDNKLEEIELYIKLEIIYSNIPSVAVDTKIHFISLLRRVLTNVVMLKHAIFIVYLQLYNFILCLEASEMVNNVSGVTLPINHLQSLLDFLIEQKELTEMVRMIIVLIKRYLPQNLNSMPEQKVIVTLQLLFHQLKKLNELLSQGGYVRVKEVMSEINDFLYQYPPSRLNKSLALFQLYFDLFNEVKKVTDLIIKNKKHTLNEITDAITFVKTKKDNVSDEYIKYLTYVVYKC